VLEPLSGYLALGASVYCDNSLHGEAFNFGPRAEQNHTVLDLIHKLAENWGFDNIKKAYKVTGDIPFHEAGLLKLNCDKALFYLKWECNLLYSETTLMVSEWYSTFYHSKGDMYDFTLKQIDDYEQLGLARNRIWSSKI
jgi:CDP-glucose 4,6-dehydratase